MSAGVPPRSAAGSVAAVIWDYDGTLVDTFAADQAAVAELIASDPQAAAGAATFWALEGRPLSDRVERAWPGHTVEVLAHFDREPAPRLFAGIAEVLTELQRRGYQLAVVSSRRVGPLHRGLRQTGLQSMFRAVIGLESVHSPKPDPEGLLMALNALGVTAPQAVYIGDQPIDAEAGETARVETWTAAWSGRAHAGFIPRVALDHPHEVIECLDAFAGGEERVTLRAAG